MSADGPPTGGDDERRLKELRNEYLPSADASGGQMATVGVELGLIVVVLALLGWWADRRFGTSPFLLLAGCFVGIVGGMYRLIRTTSRRK